MLVIDFILDISQIVLADIVLSGDNALIIGMAAASFAEKDRKKIIFFGLLAAALLRILFALVASYLITIPGLLLLGSLLLYWVCFKFYQDIKEFSKTLTQSLLQQLLVKHLETSRQLAMLCLMDIGL